MDSINVKNGKKRPSAAQVLRKGNTKNHFLLNSSMFISLGTEFVDELVAKFGELLVFLRLLL